ncbi:ketosamine-3-kinase [Lepeophtheirus salmonis]|uniref:ketosamine-3-kinase n=1 Tax=Lepeophtheirus salmonis TaxID=72036 RepID=UPI001AE16E32|nr:ketosamine-3-kinase-like [Lepeophtheirus salmonis]
MSQMEDFLKESLELEFVKKQRAMLCGFISQGSVFDSNIGKLFVKKNEKVKGSVMFNGELESIKAIEKTGIVRVPRPIKVLEDLTQAYIVMEFLEMKSMYSAQFAEFGTQLAKLHLHNIELEKTDPSKYVSKFGFHCQTCCGILPQKNEWNPDWISFYTSKLQEQMDRIKVEQDDEEVEELWLKCKDKIPNLFAGITIKPSLIHGDMWSGNVKQLDDGTPVMYDAACFYGHHEYDLGIAGMFGGFSTSFYDSYHEIIPKEPGFEKRHSLYQLFHYLNHWNHFGDGYRHGSISLMEKLYKD